MDSSSVSLYLFVFAGKAGAKGTDSKKSVKKSAVAKPNTIKNLFMNSNVRRPAEVCVCWHHSLLRVFASVTDITKYTYCTSCTLGYFIGCSTMNVLQTVELFLMFAPVLLVR